MENKETQNRISNRMEMTKETVNLKTDKQKLYNLNNRERNKE